MKKNRLGYLFLVILSAILLFTFGLPFFLLLFLFWIGFAVVLGILIHYDAKNMQIQAQFRIDEEEKKKIVLNLLVETKGILLASKAVGIELECQNRMFDIFQTRRLLLNLGDKKSEYEIPVSKEQCGEIMVRCQEAYVYDLLGLFKVPITTFGEMTTVIYPQKVQMHVEMSKDIYGRPREEGQIQNRRGNDPSEMFDIREYVPGDDIRAVHWKLSSKFDELVVREFGYPFNYNILILYDVMKICSGQQIANQRNNAVLAITDALSYSMMEMNLEHNVGRVMEGELYTVPVNSRSTHDQMVLNLICRPVTESMQNGDVIYHFIRLVRRNEYTKVIYITPEYEEGAVQQLSREADVTVIKVTQGMEGTYVDTPGYSVIPVDAEQYREKVHSIVI